LITRRLSALLLLLQVLALFLLTQTWYQINMTVEGTVTSLGEFDAVATYAIVMPLSLLNATTTLVAFLVTRTGKRFLFGLSSIFGLIAACWVGLQIATKNVSGLDSQLDRLTGIAKTHGVEGLQVSVTPTPWIWVAVTALSLLTSGFLALTRASWNSPRNNNRNANIPDSSIDLWEQQRD
jgi:hypothetical protein